MRVLILNQFFYPDVSATSQLMTDLAEDLSARGVEVTVLCGRHGYLGAPSSPKEERYKGIRIVRVRSTRFSRKSLVRRAFAYGSFYVSSLFRLLLLPRQDAILALTTPPLIGLAALVSKLLRGSRVVYVVQDLYPDVAVELGVLRARSTTTRLLIRMSEFLLRHSDTVITLGECMRRRILDKGVSPDKVCVLQNWASGSQIRSVPTDQNPFVGKYNLQGKFVALYSGNMGKAHDFGTVLGAACELAHDPGISFPMIGDGPRKAELERFVREHSLTNIQFIDYCPRELLSYSLSAADAILVTLADSLEGLVVPSKLYGALASARPILYIGPHNSEAAATVRQFECGYVVPNGDVATLKNAILRLRANPEEARRMGRNARAALEAHFDRPLITRRYYDLLVRVVGAD